MSTLLNLSRIRRTLTGPFLAIGSRVKEHLVEGSCVGEYLLFDPAKEELVTVPDQIIPKELVDARLVGVSQRWGICSVQGNGSLVMSDYLNPSKMIPLPPLTALPGELLSNVAMSSDSPFEEDCVVAIKFSGSQISLCKPSIDLPWTNVELPFSIDSSNLIFSKRDDCFCLPTPGGNYLCSLDLHNDPKVVREIVFRDFPKWPVSEWELLNSYSREEHLVESSSGECFLVKWYTYVSPLEQREPKLMVFRERKRRLITNTCVTQRTLKISASSFQKASSLSVSKLARSLVWSPTPFTSRPLNTSLCTISPPEPGVNLNHPQMDL